MPRVRVVDFETSGMDAATGAQVCEVGICDVFQEDGAWQVGAPLSWLCRVAVMPAEVRAVHHIRFAECADQPPFDAPALVEDARTDGVDLLAAHNSRFESQWLTPRVLGDFKMLCTFKSALRVFPDAPGHSNGVLRYWLEDRGLVSPDHALTMPPHRAGPDAYVTAWTLRAMLQLGATAREMDAWTRTPAFFPTCPIGEWRGKPWREVDNGFLSWMLRQANMDADYKWNAARELERRRDHG